MKSAMLHYRLLISMLHLVTCYLIPPIICSPLSGKLDTVKDTLRDVLCLACKQATASVFIKYAYVLGRISHTTFVY